jgi:hypothetical protein
LGRNSDYVIIEAARFAMGLGLKRDKNSIEEWVCIKRPNGVWVFSKFFVFVSRMLHE